jgi:hypothetical protein
MSGKIAVHPQKFRVRSFSGQKPNGLPDAQLWHTLGNDKIFGSYVDAEWTKKGILETNYECQLV